MKARLRTVLFLLPAALFLSDCAFSDYGYRINQEQMELARMEERRHKLETQYIIVLNSLEYYPTDAKLQAEKQAVFQKLIELEGQIGQRRRLLSQSLQEWERKIVEERIEQEMIEKEVRENEGVQEF